MWDGTVLFQRFAGVQNSLPVAVIPVAVIAAPMPPAGYSRRPRRSCEGRWTG